ncbi:hypothetical protein Tco_0514022 [Tanacetum coccineum]
MALTAYADTNHTGCQDTRRRTFGSDQFLEDKLVSWSSKKQKSTVIQPTEVNICQCLVNVAQDTWMSCNCQVAQSIRTPGPKHIDIRHHSYREQVEKGVAELYFVMTDYLLADIFTKALPRERF